MLSVCCLSGGPPGRLSALLELLRPVADEIVVALDERVDLALAGPVAALADVLVRYPYAEPVERPRGWMHSLARGDWVFTIDDDEVPSAELLDVLAQPDETLTHAWLPRRWLWGDGWLTDEPWAPDWQLRLVRPEAARYPGIMHVALRAEGPHAYLDAPLYHLDLDVATREQREEKARRYERVRPGLRFGGLPLNAAYYLPELREPVRTAPVPAADARLVEHVRAAAAPAPGDPPAVRLATREEVDAHWGEAPLEPDDYRAELELGPPPSPVAGEVRKLDVRVTNLGGATWPRGADGIPDLRVAYRYEGHDAAGLRTPFPRPVGPGETVRLPVSFEAPAVPGTYTLVVDLVHERHRWFGCEQAVELVVRPRRRAAILVGQPPGEAVFDERVERALASLDPELEPFLIGPRPDWLRDRFGVEAAAELPPWRPDEVVIVAAGRRLHRLRLTFVARRLLRRARR